MTQFATRSLPRTAPTCTLLISCIFARPLLPLYYDNGDYYVWCITIKANLYTYLPAHVTCIEIYPCYGPHFQAILTTDRGCFALSAETKTKDVSQIFLKMKMEEMLNATNKHKYVLSSSSRAYSSPRQLMRTPLKLL